MWILQMFQLRLVALDGFKLYTTPVLFWSRVIVTVNVRSRQVTPVPISYHLHHKNYYHMTEVSDSDIYYVTVARIHVVRACMLQRKKNMGIAILKPMGYLTTIQYEIHFRA